jgi:hypothetical protein
MFAPLDPEPRESLNVHAILFLKETPAVRQGARAVALSLCSDRSSPNPNPIKFKYLRYILVYAYSSEGQIRKLDSVSVRTETIEIIIS